MPATSWASVISKLVVQSLVSPFQVTKLRMKKGTHAALWIAVAVVAILGGAILADGLKVDTSPSSLNATTQPSSTTTVCNQVSLLSCIPFLNSSNPPSTTCCEILEKQRPCLGLYVHNDKLKPYLCTPRAKKVGIICNVNIPDCH